MHGCLHGCASYFVSDIGVFTVKPIKRKTPTLSNCSGGSSRGHQGQDWRFSRFLFSGLLSTWLQTQTTYEEKRDSLSSNTQNQHTIPKKPPPPHPQPPHPPPPPPPPGAGGGRGGGGMVMAASGKRLPTCWRVSWFLGSAFG